MNAHQRRIVRRAQAAGRRYWHPEKKVWRRPFKLQFAKAARQVLSEGRGTRVRLPIHDSLRQSGTKMRLRMSQVEEAFVKLGEAMKRAEIACKVCAMDMPTGLQELPKGV